MLEPLFFGLIAAFVTTIGLLAVALRADWSARYASLFGLAAAGMLGTMVFLHILPEAFAHAKAVSYWLAIGFFGGLLLNYSVRVLFPEKPDGGRPAEAFAPLFAIAIHSFIDGMVYSVTFAASFTTGVLSALSLIMHEFPEGIIAFAILRRHGISNRMAFIWAFLAAAVTTPLGVLVSGPFMYIADEHVIGVLFALSAGLLLYVATGPLLAPLNETRPAQGLGALGAGILVALALMSLPLPDSHDHSTSGHFYDLDHPANDPHHRDQEDGHD